MAAGSVLKMRDNEMGMIPAEVLWSPWTDVTENGDTYFTLKDANPLIPSYYLVRYFFTNQSINP